MNRLGAYQLYNESGYSFMTEEVEEKVAEGVYSFGAVLRYGSESGEGKHQMIVVV